MYKGKSLEDWCKENDRTDFLNEWDYEKNKCSPSDVAKSSHYNAFWICPKHHSYLGRISNRTSNDNGCPYCSGHKTMPGFNDLMTTNPYLAAEWDYKRNYPLTPKNVTAKSGKKYYWKCSVCGYEYVATCANRSKGEGCSKCSKRGTSFPEQATFYYLKKVYPDAENRFMDFGFELDIYIPSKKVAIEYDGVYYHSKDKSIDKDNRKDSLCKNYGITLIRMRDPSLEDTDNAIIIECIDGTDYQRMSQSVLQLLSILKVTDVDVDIYRDRFDILASSASIKKERSLINSHPQLAAEWDYDRNYPLRPEQVTAGMRTNVWWICPNCNNSYTAALYARKKGSGCPECGKKRRPLKHSENSGKKNNLFDTSIDAVLCFDKDRNRNIDTSKISVANRLIEIAWKCPNCGNERKSTAYDFSRNTGCPECAKERTRQKARRKVINLDTGEIFDSLTEAAEKYGVDKRAISSNCLGIQKSVHGYHFEYAEEKKRRSRQTSAFIQNVETKELFRTITAAAEAYSVDRTSISSALRGKTKTSAGFHWEFVNKDSYI